MTTSTKKRRGGNPGAVLKMPNAADVPKVRVSVRFPKAEYAIVRQAAEKRKTAVNKFVVDAALAAAAGGARGECA